ncbi:hypothetical protein ACFWGC_13070 [Cytobacillus pseudoceanisediminis]|uniref:hypothetical protein n=1 Tax=Cytobacillus pseudoceanisediminis TaxID=3051614 RepID=UPI003658EE77
MNENSQAVYVTIVIYSKEPDGHGVGVELNYKVNDQFQPFHIISLWLPKEDFPSERKVLFHIFAETAKHLSENTEFVNYRATSPYFAHSRELMKRKSGVFLGDRQRYFTHLKKSPRWALGLALDGVKRKNSIEERLM